MDLVKMLAATFSLSVMLGLFSAVGPSFAQEAPAVAPIAPAPEAKKEDPGAAPAQFTQGLLEQIGYDVDADSGHVGFFYESRFRVGGVRFVPR